MLLKRGNYPEIAYVILDPTNQQSRIKIRCRVLSYPAIAIKMENGIMTSSTSIQIITPTKIDLRKGLQSRLLYKGVLYSIKAVAPMIEDNINTGLIKLEYQLEYMIIT